MKQAILFFIAGTLLLVCAQAQQEKTAPVDPLALTPAEVEAGAKASQPITEATTMVNDLLIVAAHHRPTRNAQADRDKLAEMGSRLVMIATAMKDAEAQYKTWLDGVRKAHNCASCELRDGKLIQESK